jgi:outer membrane cobalamin receptor
VSPGSPSPHSPLVLALIFSSPVLADDLFLDNEALPQVLTATRLKQSPAAVPGSMTVIDSALIHASGARDITRFIGPGAPAGTSAEQALANQVLDQWRNSASQTVCGDIDQSTRESRYDLELLDTLSLADNLRLVSGINYRYDQSSARYFVKTRGPGDLDQEHMRSRELGYNGYFPEPGLALDVKLFHDEITDMISEPLLNNQYIASNANKARFSGVETQPTTLIDNNYDQRHVMYFSAELEL